MRQIMRGEVSPVMTAAILTGLRVKKETVDEIAGAAMVLREFSAKVEAPADAAHFVDIVGTGGDGANTFNISTAAMFVVAAAGAKVAKHGNSAARRRTRVAPTCSRGARCAQHRAGASHRSRAALRRPGSRSCMRPTIIRR